MTPFPLEGGRAGMGVFAPPFPYEPQRRSAFSAKSMMQGARTPTQPSPLEGEGSYAMAPATHKKRAGMAVCAPSFACDCNRRSAFSAKSVTHSARTPTPTLPPRGGGGLRGSAAV
jgi:hypothetical protein